MVGPQDVEPEVAGYGGAGMSTITNDHLRTVASCTAYRAREIRRAWERIQEGVWWNASKFNFSELAMLERCENNPASANRIIGQYIRRYRSLLARLMGVREWV